MGLTCSLGSCKGRCTGVEHNGSSATSLCGGGNLEPLRYILLRKLAQCRGCGDARSRIRNTNCLSVPNPRLVSSKPAKEYSASALTRSPSANFIERQVRKRLAELEQGDTTADTIFVRPVSNTEVSSLEDCQFRASWEEAKLPGLSCRQAKARFLRGTQRNRADPG